MSDGTSEGMSAGRRHWTARRGFIATAGFGLVSLYLLWASYGAAPLGFDAVAGIGVVGVLDQFERHREVAGGVARQVHVAHAARAKRGGNFIRDQTGARE